MSWKLKLNFKVSHFYQNIWFVYPMERFKATKEVRHRWFKNPSHNISLLRTVNGINLNRTTIKGGIFFESLMPQFKQRGTLSWRLKLKFSCIFLYALMCACSCITKLRRRLYFEIWKNYLFRICQKKKKQKWFKHELISFLFFNLY